MRGGEEARHPRDPRRRVFPHGGDSVYFNKYGTYGEGAGAYRDERAPTAPGTASVRGQRTTTAGGDLPRLPNVNEMEKSYRAFMQRRRRRGRALDQGRHLRWRLDVADELPMPFFARTAPPRKDDGQRGDAAGEVWEDPPTRSPTAEAAAYCAGDTLDSVMNYLLPRGGAGVFHLQDRRLRPRAAHRGHAREHAALVLAIR